MEEAGQCTNGSGPIGGRRVAGRQAGGRVRLGATEGAHVVTTGRAITRMGLYGMHVQLAGPSDGGSFQRPPISI